MKNNYLRLFKTDKLIEAYHIHVYFIFTYCVIVQTCSYSFVIDASSPPLSLHQLLAEFQSNATCLYIFIYLKQKKHIYLSYLKAIKPVYNHVLL